MTSSFMILAFLLSLALKAAASTNYCICTRTGPSAKAITSMTMVGMAYPVNQQSCMSACSATSGCNLALPFDKGATGCVLYQIDMSQLGATTSWGQIDDGYFAVMRGQCSNFGAQGICYDTTDTGSEGASFSILSTTETFDFTTTTQPRNRRQARTMPTQA